MTEAMDEMNGRDAAGAGPRGMPVYEEAPQPHLSRGARLWLFVRDLFRMRSDRSGQRVTLVGAFFVVLFATLIGRLSWMAMHPKAPNEFRGGTTVAAARPDIIDRNGVVLATDIKTVSVFAEPRNIIDADEATELLTAVLPDLDARELRDKLSTSKGFVWVKRQITPRQQAEVHRLGIPGVGFVPENKRVYPNGPIGAHVLGFANVDNEGIAGIEKYMDNQGLKALAGYGFARSADDLEPVRLSLDLRATAAARDELVKGLAYFRAKAAASLILDVNTGEVVSLVSLPDYDPNNPVDALQPDRINRMIVGVFEMGSTFKALTLAMGLDSGKANINSTYDARGGLHYGRFTIKDYHGKNRILNVPEIFIYSSNIGTARMALQQGVPAHKAFLKKMGQLDRMRTEMPESSAPLLPPNWGELNTITISYGHGLAVAPMQAAAAVGALVNGGQLVNPTFLLRTEQEARANAPQVIKPETSEAMRFVMRLNATKGSARKADVPGYFVGGKTGTADKVINGRYAKNKNFTTFMTVLPADDPKYLFLTVYDEPQATADSYGYATAAWNAGVTTGKIMARVAPLLGLPPRFDEPANPFPTMARLGAWGL
ncbi:cell division protein FtsI (penicillin-binding protein 3) [Pseudochelatococcus lubricantis]|uniref:Cell division protein FtsI (Penicillin-binding protein 3) n=1 Tax=Pseudochelatococcus lubricantis TaxID=1538102 RepID=A0ABX0V2X9_9HYPH|nr:penicillin-binding protein 2 [Pseudochelatococcus lubricantis]NIJ59576.1 cell division protein FtsI (penicillin-binding protein 3) [Pseudochelatococcus lubricantis]